MRRIRFSVPARAAVAFGILALLTGAFEAGPAIVDPTTGVLMSVDVVSDPLDPYVQGVRLTSVSPGGQSTSEFIPSTYDPVIDAQPAIAINPLGGVVVVWSRDDGHDMELALSWRSIGGLWSAESILTGNSKEDTEARLLVDAAEQAHVLWWGDGVGGPVFLQSFDIRNGQPIGPRSRPFEPPNGTPGRRPNSSDGTEDWIGGLDDPAVPTSSASAYSCSTNPTAVPDHGPLMACGRPAAWQLTSCRLVVGVLDTATGAWTQTITNVASLDLSQLSAREMAQGMADYACR